MRSLTKEEQEEYDQLTAKAEQIEFRLSELQSKPARFGYARVSSKGQAIDGSSLETQKSELKASGVPEENIYSDVYTGATTDRPELDKLIGELRSGDTMVVTKLDRIARSVQQGSKLIGDLVDRGVAVNVLNMGTIDNTPTGRLILHIMLSFAEFERDMIVQRTREGREATGHYGGRKPTYSPEQISLALDLLKSHSYTEVTKMTGISRSTLLRAKQHSKSKTIQQ